MSLALFASQTATAPPPLVGGLEFREGVPLIALALALVAFVTTVRMWLTKALIDTEDAIRKEGAPVRESSIPAGKDNLQEHFRRLRGRAVLLKRQLNHLWYADVLAIAAGLMAMIGPFWYWLPVINWVHGDDRWHPTVAGYQLFFLAVMCVLGVYIRYQLVPDPESPAYAVNAHRPIGRTE